ncbi:hypothetical protein [uncultured Phocaeicola sp.]|uniref:hypothetical protein n=1 Tax=uncultured Phocaeicola sp. TaxID=990718 RepID=UPI0025FC6BBB|nr:hypothetical protein [uncultured Phocaeicola sp.]
MANRKTIEHCMIFELFTIKDFFSYFGDGYCIEMPSNKTKLDNLLNYLSTQKAVWKFYATLTNGTWFHGIHITFQNEKRIKAETIMQNICKILGIGSYCVYAGGTQTIIDAEGDVIAFVDFSEM